MAAPSLKLASAWFGLCTERLSRLAVYKLERWDTRGCWTRRLMVYWVHIARSIDRATLHRERCTEIPSNVIRTDFWEGGWFDYPDKERALAAMEQSGASVQRMCPLCKP